jgi:hypothetical protein
MPIIADWFICSGSRPVIITSWARRQTRSIEAAR